jgi:hypothetical protein
MIFMMWYEPYSSPNEWALNTAPNLDKLEEYWQYCKFNPSVLQVYTDRLYCDHNGFNRLLYWYKANGASINQYKDLFKMAFVKLQKDIDERISAHSKGEEHDNNCLINGYILIACIILHGDPINTIINRYDTLPDCVRNAFVSALITIYDKKFNHTVYVDRDAAENYIRDICKNVIKQDIRYDETQMIIPNEPPFRNFAQKIIKRGGCEEGFVNFINDTIHDYELKSVLKSARSIPKLQDICDKQGMTTICDIYETLKFVLGGKKESELAVALIADRDYNKDCLCKATKFCIDNFNYYNGNQICKECEESVIEGIMGYHKIPILNGVDIESEMFTLEAVSYGSFVATEAKNEEEEPPEDSEEPEEPTEEEEENPNDTQGPKKQKEHYQPKGIVEKSEQKQRDFNRDFRKYKKNFNAVDASLTKIVGGIKDLLTGQSDIRGRRKATGMDSVAQVLARVFGTIAIFSVNGFLGLLFVIVRLANSGKVSARERAKLITEIRNEIEVIDEQLNDGSITNPEARKDLMRNKRNLQDALDKIERKQGKHMTDGAKQAVRELNERR